MLQIEVIQESHIAWASLEVLVPKMYQMTRFSVDFRKVNAITTDDAYLLPRVE